MAELSASKIQSWSLLVLNHSSLSQRRAPLPSQPCAPQASSQYPHQTITEYSQCQIQLSLHHHHSPGPDYHHLPPHGSASSHSSSHNTAGVIFSTWIRLCLTPFLREKYPTTAELPTVASCPSLWAESRSLQLYPRQLSFSPLTSPSSMWPQDLCIPL